MGKHSPNRWDYKVNWQKSQAINQGDKINELRLVLKGNLIIAFVNQKRVGYFWDNSYKSGKIGLASRRDKGDEVAVYFDNLIIQEKGN